MDNVSILSDSTYRVECELGSGGGGVVYKAWHTRLQKYVVIKELKTGSNVDIEVQRNEVEALKNVKSAYLPQVLDFFSESGRFFTVMEFIDGQSFDKLLELQARFSQSQVVKWYGQLVQALEVIHRNNIAHRDIKPANVMLLPSGDVCLIDFNAALVGESDFQLISRSLGYASPEQYEIYEHAKTARSSGFADIPQIGYNANADYEKTELLNNNATEIVSANLDFEKTEIVSTNISNVPNVQNETNWKLSDIYSLGATMYHLLSGVRPSECAANIVPISKAGRFSEGLCYIIEKSMSVNPAERFPSAEMLSKAIFGIHKLDSRWKSLQAKQIAVAITLPLVFSFFVGMTAFGRNKMNREMEERYYETVYAITEGENPQKNYNAAVELFPNRIDSYFAMAQRFWNDGDIEGCKTYIERNLGNLAKFQNDPDSAERYGYIYYILGNCYYFSYGSADYRNAGNCYRTALDYVKDNAEIYRDYAIVLTRLGNVDEAQKQLEKAQVLNLNEDSLNLLKGELNFAQKNYDGAIDILLKTIDITNDDYMRYRAYHTLDEIYKTLQRPQDSVALLKQAINQVPLNRATEMTERLADAYCKIGEYGKAVELFEELTKTSVPQLHIMQNILIILENERQFDRAEDILNQMEKLFPNDYRVYMRGAFLEADRQSETDNLSRDYSLTKEYYDKATELYQQNVKPGEQDYEMQQLESLIQQLRNNKWID